MKPGRELDSRVAKEVFGFTASNGYWHIPEGHNPETFPPDYSTDIAAAWKVVEKLDSKEISNGFLMWKCEYFVGKKNKYNFRFEIDFMNFAADAPTIPHAICLAALKAVKPVPSDSL